MAPTANAPGAAAPPQRRRRFLSAEWRNLLMLNYVVPPELLAPFVPAGTELDSHDGRTFMSLVAFQFLRTRVLGVPVPLHVNFEEVNLRFYVRRPIGREARRAVVFVQELVPRPAIAAVARTLYNEAYRSTQMKSQVSGDPPYVRYSWHTGTDWNSVQGQAAGVGQVPEEGSHQAFISDQHWGYTRQRDGGTVEYRVEHPRWSVWQAEQVILDADLERLYGRALAAVMTRPWSAFIAAGSQVTVSRPVRI